MYERFSFFLTGDSQYQERGEAISAYPELHGITFLQVPYHSSRTGLTQEILAVFHPQIAPISVGAHNSYGHPAPSTLSVLQNVGVKIYRTDQKGTVRLASDGRSYNVR